MKMYRVYAAALEVRVQRQGAKPCGIDTAPARAPATRSLYLHAMPAMDARLTVGGHVAEAVAALQDAWLSSERWGPSLREALALPNVDELLSLVPRSHEPRRDVPEETALDQLRRIADPTFWTWDAVVVRERGEHSSRYVGTSKVASSDRSVDSGTVYLVSYEMARLACAAPFRTDVEGPVGEDLETRSALAALDQLRAYEE